MTLYTSTGDEIGSTLFKSTDGGANWIPINNGLPGVGVRALVIDPTNPMTLYAGTSRGLNIGGVFSGGGVFKSTDGGANWIPISTGLSPFFSVNTLVIDPTDPMTLYAGSDSSFLGGVDLAP